MKGLTLEFRRAPRVSFREIIAGAFASAFCAACIPALLLPLLSSVPGPWPLWAFGGALLAALVYLLQFLPFGKHVPLAAGIVILLLTLLFFRTVRSGMSRLSNDVLEYLTGRTGRIHLLYPENGTAGTFLVPFLYLILLSVVSARMILKRRLFWPVLLLALFAAANALSLPVSGGAVLLPLLACAVAPAACRPSGRPGNAVSGKSAHPDDSGRSARRDSSGTSARHGGSGTFRMRHAEIARFRAPSSAPLHLLLPLLAALLLTFLLAGGISLFAGENALNTSTAVEALAKRAHVRRYEKNGPSGMPEGDLRSRISQDTSEKPMLRLSAEEPGKLYLRGFTADVYKDSVWGPVSAESYIENAALFGALHDAGFFGQEMIASAAEASGKSAPAETVTVTYLGACREFRYLPYALADKTLPDPMAIGDAGVRSRQEASDAYNVSFLPGSLPEWVDILLSLAENADSPAVTEYLRAEQAYYEYVLTEDRQLSPEAAAGCAALFGEERTERRLADILSLVRETLDGGFAYTKERGPVSGNDAFTVFLDAKESSAADFASAACLMLRYLGVPARYVEGYYLSPEEALRSSEEITLTGEDAHAWAEFYVRGIGWIPFETVPGYVDNDELSRLADFSLDEEAAGGLSLLYRQAEVTYTSGIEEAVSSPEDAAPETRFRPVFLLLLPAAVLLILLAVFLRRVLRNRRRYRDEMRKIENAKASGDFKTAVTLEFGYASMLMRCAGIAALPGLEEMRALNGEARFSNHVMTESDARTASSFTQNVLRASCAKWNLRQRIYYRLIRRII